LAKTNRTKAIKGVLDQRPPADRRHRLAHAITVGP
jgi:hypothetical protein